MCNGDDAAESKQALSSMMTTPNVSSADSSAYNSGCSSVISCNSPLRKPTKLWYDNVTTLPGKSWKVMEFSKTIFQAWKVMENSQDHGKS